MTCFMCGFETTTPTCDNTSCQSCIAVAKLDEEINQVVTTLRRLLATRRDVRSEQNRIHDPMRRLPIELRNYIFELLLPRRYKWVGIVHDRFRERLVMPSHLASICRSWHDTASSNPFLWSTMDLRIGGRVSQQISTSSQIHFVRDWILRSQSLPLTLHIKAHDEEGIEEELNGILDAISQSSTRWLCLSLDMPNRVLRTFHHSNFPYHHLKRLRIYNHLNYNWHGLDQLVPLLNPKVSPEEIHIRGISFQSLQISWDHLTTAIVTFDGVADVMQLFQHASQMTSCWIRLYSSFENVSTPPITHQSLKVFGLLKASEAEAMSILGCLMLPSLQKFHTNQLVHLTPAFLPALVRRSSCPLTSITLGVVAINEVLLDMQPLPGVTNLVLETMSDVVFKKLLLEEYFPDLLRLTLPLEPFLHLWDKGIISALFDRNRQRCLKLLVADERQAFRNNIKWNSDFRKQLKVFDIKWRGHG